MLRLPVFDVVAPESVEEVLELLDEYGERAQLIAGGTDLVPNMKHELFTPDLVVSLAAIPELSGIRVEADGALLIGAMARLDEVASHPDVIARAPALAQAAGVVAGPQLRRMGTLGGNVMLDTRCQWYNQTYFWREALGFCLKKDGTECHVVAGGQKCVAAASNDTAPALMSLRAQLTYESTAGERVLPIDELWLADGIYNKTVQGEVLTEIRVPAQAARHHGAYGKLRERGSIDFPLLGLATRVDLDAKGKIADADVCAVALQARPTHLKKVRETLVGLEPKGPAFDAALEAVAEAAYRQCRPLANVPGDHDYRREMVPVYVRRTLRAALAGDGPVVHL